MNLVRHILDDARKRLAVLSRDSLVAEAAEVLANPEMPIVVVCDSEGIAVGVVSRGDIVRVLACAKGDAHKMTTSATMTTAVLSCHVDQTLRQVWESMNARSLRAVPIFDGSGRPQGVVFARDLARALLDEMNEEELSLRDYVLGIGYQ